MEMSIFWALAEHLLEYSTLFVTWAATLQAIAFGSDTLESTKKRLLPLVDLVTKIATSVWSEGYCHFISFLEFAYYPQSNNPLLLINSGYFQPIQYSTTNQLSKGNIHRLTGYVTPNLMRLFTHWQVPDGAN